MDAEAEGPKLWLPDVKRWLIGKDPEVGEDWGQEEKGMTEDERVGWHHWLNGHELEQTLGDGEGQGSLAYYSPRGRKESDTTEWLNWTELNTVKGFSVVSEAEVDVFSGIPLLFLWSNRCWQFDFWFLLPFLNPAWTYTISQLMYCWSLAWRILNITLLVCEMSAIVWYFEHSLALPFFEIGMKTDLFQSCGHCWVFQIFWHIECSTFTALSFRIWNSSAGIPSPPLTLFIVMLRKPHLTSHSRMSGLKFTSYLISKTLPVKKHCLLFCVGK